ncbi:hypothetical protein [Asticcacaulis machinosus]|uniref:EF-hand domain-containing protein n=1 Tax=Asticcacaulis machinosus TaxID=2984211 RepID=A0ABT5HIL3_9CAUL|nr:hypothetical protein [Asticcacaulis machinosus]MDC7676087.1 hypothetical protein [Asticcacaulis machinosus]
MTRFFLFLPLLVLTAPAVAQMPSEGGPDRPAINQIFFSPSGEVFRAKTPAPYPVADWFKKADADSDGKLTRAEFVADAKRYFAVIDKDENGVISSPENTRYEEELAPEILSRVPMITQPPKGRTTDAEGKPLSNQPYQRQITGAAQFSLINEPQPVRGADANFDFKITSAEWESASLARFRLLDKDSDGALTLDTLSKTPMQQALEAPRDGKDKKRRR